jgi:hypothetical protein
VSEIECLLSPARFAQRMDVSASTVKAWRRLGLLRPDRDYTWLPSTRPEPQTKPSDRNLRYKWPQARDSILAETSSATEPIPNPNAAETQEQRPERKDGPAVDVNYRAPS